VNDRESLGNKNGPCIQARHKDKEGAVQDP
jgi:hypothetical protein